MKIEVVGFYPNAKPPTKKNRGLGTLHVYLVDIGLDIRGIGVVKNGKGYYFLSPQKYGNDENREPYPVVTFTDPVKQKEYIQALKTVATEFLNEELKKGKE